VRGSAAASSVVEGVALAGFSDAHVVIEALTREVTEPDSIELASDFASEIIAGDFMGGGSSLLVNEGDDTVSGTTAGVVSGLAVSERYINEKFCADDTNVLGCKL